MYIATNLDKKFRLNIGFFQLTPRLGCINHLGIFSFWISIMAIGAFFPKILPHHYYLTESIQNLLIFFGIINLILIKIRRLNDFDCSGWWVLLCVIPIIGWLWFFIIFCIPGTPDSNRFGNQPTSLSLINFFLILAAPLTYFILYLFGIYDLT